MKVRRHLPGTLHLRKIGMVQYMTWNDDDEEKNMKDAKPWMACTRQKRTAVRMKK